MDIFNIDPSGMMSFLLTIIRVSLIVFLLPFFGGDTIPIQVKAAVSIMLTLAIWPRMALGGQFFPAHPFNLALLVFSEVLLGMVLGAMVHFIFVGLQVGGEVIGFQMGLSMITLADPGTGTQLTATSFLMQSVAMAIFLSMDGHLYILSALIGSFNLIAPGQLFLSPPALNDLIHLSAQMFSLALKIAGPVIGCLFLVELGLALMAKVAPQMNLLTLGFPIKIALGLMLLSITFTLVALFFDDFIKGSGNMFDNIMRTLRVSG
jgi:flagellar biosynthetic protein FliR